MAAPMLTCWYGLPPEVNGWLLSASILPLWMPTSVIPTLLRGGIGGEVYKHFSPGLSGNYYFPPLTGWKRQQRIKSHDERPYIWL